jgi:hypothetical protein
MTRTGRFQSWWRGTQVLYAFVLDSAGRRRVKAASSPFEHEGDKITRQVFEALNSSPPREVLPAIASTST